MAEGDVSDLLKLGDPNTSSTQKLIRLIVPDIDDANLHDGDIARQLRLLPLSLGDVCRGVSRHDHIIGLSVSDFL